MVGQAAHVVQVGADEPLAQEVEPGTAIDQSEAVQHFDAAKGGDFLSYAVPTVRGELRRWFRDAGWVVRPPRSVQELQARITRARSEVTHELGRPPGLPPGATQRVIITVNMTLRLEKPIEAAADLLLDGEVAKSVPFRVVQRPKR